MQQKCDGCDSCVKNMTNKKGKEERDIDLRVECRSTSGVCEIRNKGSQERKLTQHNYGQHGDGVQANKQVNTPQGLALVYSSSVSH